MLRAFCSTRRAPEPGAPGPLLEPPSFFLHAPSYLLDWLARLFGQNSVRGAHFSMFASGSQFDSVQFDKAMNSAGFDVANPIHYFGGGVSDWRKGLVNSCWWKQEKALPFDDEAQKAWIAPPVITAVFPFSLVMSRILCWDCTSK
jgi:hypothetical protein